MKKIVVLGLCLTVVAGVMALNMANGGFANSDSNASADTTKNGAKADEMPAQLVSKKTSKPVENVSPVDTAKTTQEVKPDGKVKATFPCDMLSYPKMYGKVKKVYNVANIDDKSKVYRPEAVKENCFIVVSKQEYRLYVYEVVGKDTLIAAHYPVCYGKNAENKTRTGDRCTPESSMDAPFTISNIQDYSARRHDFGDGRGSILSYGNWFMRLDLSKSHNTASVRSNTTIGIHGSTNNAPSVPGQDSEGCIRLRDNDIKNLKSNFAYRGMKVVVKPRSQGKLLFEKTAEQKCTGYQCAYKGYVEY